MGQQACKLPHATGELDVYWGHVLLLFRRLRARSPRVRVDVAEPRSFAQPDRENRTSAGSWRLKRPIQLGVFFGLPRVTAGSFLPAEQHARRHAEHVGELHQDGHPDVGLGALAAAWRFVPSP
jgi:hypothetical protein